MKPRLRGDNRILCILLVTEWLAVVGFPVIAGVAQDTTTLGIDGCRFTLNGRPTFLLGFSYYAALGAPKDFVRQDLDDFQARGFQWLRVWATWDAFDHVVSAVDPAGRPRQPFFDRLQWLVAECDRRRMVVDITLARHRPSQGEPGGGLLPDFAAHQRAVETLVTRLKPYRNWYLDLANERDVRDARFVSPEELKRLRELVRRLDPRRLVTASFGGHDLSERDIREAVQTVGLDFLSPHRPRNPRSPGQTQAHTEACLKRLRELGRMVPVHYQEPFRRGYARWQPKVTDFVTDLRGALDGGAAGWCFHNGSQRDAPDQQPRRSCDLRQRRLWVQLDAEEKAFVETAGKVLNR